MSDEIRRVVRRDFDQYATPGQLPPIDWTVYDVPAMMRACAGEGKQQALDQVKAWHNLSQAKMAEFDNFRRIRERIAAAWPPEKSPAATKYLEYLDKMLFSISNVAATALGNAQRIETIVTTLAGARQKLEPLQRKWNATTSVWNIEHWDDTANRLNEQARQVMREAEKVVAEEATGITEPVPYDGSIRVAPRHSLTPDPDGSPDSVVGLSDSPSGWGGSGSGVPRPGVDRSAGGGLSPTAGGRSPVIGQENSGDVGPWPGWQPVPGPDLSGVATAGGPGQAGSSMLPIPPGNPYAPHGGTYTLPGPGNPQGFITRAAATAPGGGITAGPGAGTAGMAMMPGPMGGAPAARGGQGGASPYRGRANTVWEVAQGVPPVIEGTPWTDTRQQPGNSLDDLFQDDKWLDDPDLAARISFRNTEETR